MNTRIALNVGANQSVKLGKMQKDIKYRCDRMKKEQITARLLSLIYKDIADMETIIWKKETHQRNVDRLNRRIAEDKEMVEFVRKL